MKDRLYRAARAFCVPLATGALVVFGYAAAAYWPHVWRAAPRDAAAGSARADYHAAGGQSYPPTLLRLPDEVRPVALKYSAPDSEVNRGYMAEPELGNPAIAIVTDAQLAAGLRRIPPVNESDRSLDPSSTNVPGLPRWSDSPSGAADKFSYDPDEFSLGADARTHSSSDLSQADGRWYDESMPAIQRLPAVSGTSVAPGSLELRGPAASVPSDAMDSDTAKSPFPVVSKGPAAIPDQTRLPTRQPELPRDELGQPKWPQEKVDELELPVAPDPIRENTQPARDQNPARPVSVPIEHAARADAGMSAVSQRADELTRHGFSLAERGAFYSARADFIQALRLISQALDVQTRGQDHSQALANGLQALKEADDFVPKGSRLEADLDLAIIVAGHRTPALKDEELVDATPLQALQQYYTYAQQQLTLAGAREPAASMALYGLGRLHTALSEQSAESQKMNGPKAMALHQAALLIDSNNYRAANELGVLLARYGQLQDARTVLLHGVTVGRQPDAWYNLSVIHERLGETDLSRRAHHEYQLAAAVPHGDAARGGATTAGVQWVPPETFATPPPTPVAAAAEPPPEKKEKTAWWFPWQQSKR